MIRNNFLPELIILDYYATNRNDLIRDFYSPCLSRSINYDRAVGYFRSSFLLLANEAIKDFAMRGGRIRIICSPELSSEDIQALEKGYETRKIIENSINESIEKIFEDIEGKPFVEFLATLVAINSLDLRVVFRPGALGIFHDKLGVFTDSNDNSISFRGSLNESFMAWDARGNHEAFDVFRSWSVDRARVEHHIEYFENLWSGIEPKLQTVPFPEASYKKLLSISNEDGLEAAFQEILQRRKRLRKTPMVHQLEAIESWKNRSYRGILEHATGSGKTFTAILAIEEHLQQGKPTIVIVPSVILLEQWFDELQSELSHINPSILLAGAGHSKWRNPGAVEDFTKGVAQPKIILATLQTASSIDFVQRISNESDLLILIDEVHRSGSPNYSNVFNIAAGKRLGLSATPIRYGDPIGTDRIFSYFDGVIQPPFTIEDAIRVGRLCNYTYHIHEVELTNEEQDRWDKFTKQIKTAYAQSPRTESGDVLLSERVKILLIQRARVIKSAINKVSLAIDVITKFFEEGDRWLIYCDTQDQLKDVLGALRAAGINSDEYHSNMRGDRQTTLGYFSSIGGVLVAIRCLDEGVDIPEVDHALILASSKNPREFIQRRGRVLRKSDKKYFAEIHDAIVLSSNDNNEPETLAILKGELARAYRFSQSASNEGVKIQIQSLARKLNIDTSGEIALAGIEEEDND